MGKTTTLVFDGRETNLSFAEVAASLLRQARKSSFIIDLDALYSSNSDVIFGQHRSQVAIHVPDPESNVERELNLIFEADRPVAVIDSLNTMYHMFSPEDSGARGRKLSFAVASLSNFAATNGMAVILTVYKRERLGRPDEGKSISSLSDVTASVEIQGSLLRVTCERGAAWPGGVFSTRIPLL